MNWLSVLKTLAPIAPALFGIVGGFIPIPGASLAAQKIGEVVAGALGVPATPQAVADAATNLTTVEVAKINAALELEKARLAAGTEQEKAWAHAMEVAVAEVNATMRVEIQPENRHWFFTGWRPASGWIFVLYAATFGALLMYAGVMAVRGDATALQRLTDGWPLYAAYFGVLAAMVGVYVVARTADKITGTDTSTVKPKVPLPPVKK